jgi:hypothetical protein
MKTGCRRGYSPFPLGKHGLIAFPIQFGKRILFLSSDVWRNGHHPAFFQQGIDRPRSFESDLNQTVFAQVFNDSGEIIFKEQPISLPGPLGRPEKTPAGIRFLGFLVGMLQNEYFNAAAAFFATENPRRNHPGVVDHQEVAGQEQLRKIKKMPMFHRPGGAVHNQEARLIPLRERDLSDQFLRQVVVVVFNVEHRRAVVQVALKSGMSG